MSHRALIAVMAIALLGISASAAALTPTRTEKRQARAECRAERGVTPADHFAFAQEWGRPRPFRRCVRVIAMELARERRQTRREAIRACWQELRSDPVGFHEEYRGPRPLRQCIRQELI